MSARILSVDTNPYDVNVSTMQVPVPPLAIAGDYMISVVSLEGVRTDAASPSEMTPLTRTDSGLTFMVLGRTIDGTEPGMFDVDLPTSAAGVVRSVAVRGVQGTPVVANPSVGTSATATTPTVSSLWPGEESLALCLLSASDDDADVISYPSGFNDNRSFVVGGGGTNNGATSAICSTLTNDSSVSPGDFELAEVERFATTTLIMETVEPVAAASESKSRFPSNLRQWRNVVAKCYSEGLKTGPHPLAYHPFGTPSVGSLPCVIVSPGYEGSYVDYNEGTYSSPLISLTAFILCGDPKSPRTVDYADEVIGKLGRVHDLIYTHAELGQPADVEMDVVDEPSVLSVGSLKAYTLTVPTRLILPTT